MRTRLVPILASAAVVLLAISGCGGGDGGGSSSDPASVAPPKAPLYVEAVLQPEAKLGEEVEALVGTIAGIENVGDVIVEELEKSALDEGDPVDFAKDIEPWLGEKAGLFFEHYDGENFTDFGIAIETTDADKAQEFVEDHADSEGQSVGGMIGNLLVITESKAVYKAAEEASEGESLAGQDSFTTAMDQAVDGAIGNVFVDIGGLIKQSGGGIDPDTELFLESSGIDPEGATALASIVPGSDQVEIDFATDVNGDRPVPGNASQLLSSLPGGSFAALAASEFGRQLGESIDSIDAEGIPDEIEPHELKKAMKAVGIDLDKVSTSIEDVGVFAQGNTKKNLTGAVVLTTTDSREATNTVANIGLLLRAGHTPGVTAISGKATGFSVRDSDLDKPLIVAAQGNRIAISYGPAASAQALTAEGGATLASNPEFKEAKESLGDTAMTGFVDGPSALALATNLLAGSDDGEKLEGAEPYLEKVAFIAIGAGSAGELATAKAVIGLEK